MNDFLKWIESNDLIENYNNNVTVNCPDVPPLVAARQYYYHVCEIRDDVPEWEIDEDGNLAVLIREKGKPSLITTKPVYYHAYKDEEPLKFEAANGWELLDPDSMKVWKQTGDRQYRFIQAIWLDTVSGDKKAKNATSPSDNYVVVSAVVDLDECDENDILMAISLGGHESIEELEDAAGIPASEMEDTIAEYVFDSMEGYDTESDLVSWNDAVRLIHEMME